MIFVAIGNRLNTNFPLTDCDGKDAMARMRWQGCDGKDAMAGNEEAFSLMVSGAGFSGEGGMGRVDLGGQ